MSKYIGKYAYFKHSINISGLGQVYGAEIVYESNRFISGIFGYTEMIEDKENYDYTFNDPEISNDLKLVRICSILM